MKEVEDANVLRPCFQLNERAGPVRSNVKQVTGTGAEAQGEVIDQIEFTRLTELCDGFHGGRDVRIVEVAAATVTRVRASHEYLVHAEYLPRDGVGDEPQGIRDAAIPVLLMA